MAEVQTGQDMNRYDTHSNVTPLPRRGRNGIAMPYLVAWLILGAGAIAYLAILGLAPGLVRSEATTASAASIDKARQELALLGKNVAALEDIVSKQEGDAQALGGQIAALRDELANLRQQLVSVAGANQELQTRLAAVEQGTQQVTKKTTVKAAATTASEPLEDPAIVGTVIEDQPVPLTKKTTEKKTTETAAAAPAKTFGVELAQANSPEALRMNWELLNEQHATLFGGLTAKAAGEGGTYRLLAGPFNSQAAAKAACAKFKAQNLPCSIRAFTGDKL